VVIREVLLFTEMSRSVHTCNAMYIKIYTKVPLYSCIHLVHNGEQAKFILMLKLVKSFTLLKYGITNKIYMKAPSYSCIHLLYNDKQAKFILMLTLVKSFIVLKYSIINITY